MFMFLFDNVSNTFHTNVFSVVIVIVILIPFKTEL